MKFKKRTYTNMRGNQTTDPFSRKLPQHPVGGGPKRVPSEPAVNDANPYKCSKCGKGFATNIERTRHLDETHR